jgi:mannose-6-phosphate isomerase-like protein (cupin superfamily)
MEIVLDPSGTDAIDSHQGISSFFKALETPISESAESSSHVWESLRTRFHRDGLFDPIQLLNRRECRALLSYLDSDRRARPADWQKGRAVTDWLLYRLAADPRLAELLTLALGDAIVLWGVSVVRRPAGEFHPWHVDIESSMPSGRCASAWIGLENTRRNSGLQLIAGSHLVGQTVQQMQAERGFRRGQPSTDTILAWAVEQNPAAEIVTPLLGNGEAIVFDGRLWHGSRNDRRAGTRTALLLQFAAADTPIRMHDDAKLEWPFEFLQVPQLPAIVIHGEVTDATNRLVNPPAPAVRKVIPMLSNCVRSICIPLREGESGWQPYDFFEGSTPIIDDMECHASVLSPGHCPHPPHAHQEEELLIVLDGEAELLIADKPSLEGARVEKVGPGAFVYYPAFQHHTIRNTGQKPVSYLMFKWHVDGARAGTDELPTTVFRYGDAQPRAGHGFVIDQLFEKATGWLGKLHCHTTRLEPGAGYAAHVDAYDVAILTLSGNVETLGQEVGPHSVIYYAAGQKHGMRNIGDEPAHYLVFEFHPAALDVWQRLRWRSKPFAKRVLKRTARAVGVDLGSLRAKLRRVD